MIIQIPCFNEEQTLPATLAAIPRRMPGVTSVEILVIDDGSSDRTIAVARELGVDHILVNTRNVGLAESFRRGLEASLRLGADIIVTTDGDNQYDGSNIPNLIAPIIAGDYDIMVGDRQTDQIAHFSPLKKRLQNLGSAAASRFANTHVVDAVSGFRAMSRDAALRLNIVSNFSYTVEMLVQAGQKQMKIGWVPITTNPKTRESRLFKSMRGFIARQGTTMLRMYAMYRPLRTFLMIGGIFMVIGLIPMVRFVILFAMGEGDGKIQSIIFGSTFLVIGTLTFLLGILADLLGHNRKLLETTLEKVRRLELENHARRRLTATGAPMADDDAPGQQAQRQVAE